MIGRPSFRKTTEDGVYAVTLLTWDLGQPDTTGKDALIGYVKRLDGGSRAWMAREVADTDWTMTGFSRQEVTALLITAHRRSAAR